MHTAAVLALIMLFAVSVNFAHADWFIFDVQPGSSIWNFQRAIDNIQERMEFDAEKKQDLIQKHLEDRNAELQKCTDCTQEVKNIIIKERDQKLTRIQELESEITEAKEMPQIRQAVKDFQSGNYDRQELETRVNALQTVQKNCDERIKVAELEADKDHAYDKLQQICPRLKSIAAKEALKSLFG